MMGTWRRGVLCMLVGPALIGGAVSAGEPPAAKLKAFVSILPQAYFAERVGDSYVEVGVLVGPGQSPHTFEPTPRQVAALAQAQVYFSIGIPFEARLLQKVLAMNKRLKVVDTREGVKLRPATEPDEDEKDYVKGAPDPHTWLDPMLAKTEAANICKALQQIDPAHATDYERNLKACQDDLDAVDTRIAQALAPLKGRQFMVFHPAFGYFGDRYGLKQVAVELEGKEPSARKLAELIDKARNDGVKVIFVQPQFSRKSAEAVAHAIGGAVVPMDPLAKDYLANLQDMAEKIDKALK